MVGQESCSINNLSGIDHDATSGPSNSVKPEPSLVEKLVIPFVIIIPILFLIFFTFKEEIKNFMLRNNTETSKASSIPKIKFNFPKGTSLENAIWKIAKYEKVTINVVCGENIKKVSVTDDVEISGSDIKGLLNTLQNHTNSPNFKYEVQEISEKSYTIRCLQN